jgi:hypothetical protein
MNNGIVTLFALGYYLSFIVYLFGLLFKLLSFEISAISQVERKGGNNAVS